MTARTIAFLIQTTQGYGGEQVFETILHRAAEGGDVTPIIITVDEDIPQTPKTQGLEHLTLNRRKSGVRALWLASRTLRKLAFRGELDVIVSFMSYANVVALLAGTVGRRKLRIVISEHTELSEYLREDGRGVLVKRLYRALYSRADHCLAVSNAVRQDLIEEFGISASRVETVGNPIPIDKTRIETLIHQRDSRRENDRVRLVSIGALKVAKGHKYAIRAVAHLPATHTLDLVGDGPKRQELTELCRGLGIADRVRFHGYVSDPMEILAASDVLVHPSLREGFGLTIIEAGVLGIPVVATDVGGLPELVPSVVPGILVPPRNAEEIVKAITKVTEGSYGDSQFVIERVCQLFSPDAVANHYVRAAIGK